MRVVLEIEDTKKGEALINFLKQLPFVKMKKTRKVKKKTNIEEVFGIWKDREISQEIIRKKAWRM